MAMDDKLSAALLNYRGAEKIHRANERGQVVDRFRRNQGAPGGVRGDLGPITIKGKVGLSEAEIWKRKMEIAKMLAEAKAAVEDARAKFGEQSLEFAKANNAVKVAQANGAASLGSTSMTANQKAIFEKNKRIDSRADKMTGILKYNPGLEKGLEGGPLENVTPYGKFSGYSQDALATGLESGNPKVLADLTALIGQINAIDDPDLMSGDQHGARLTALTNALAEKGVTLAEAKTALRKTADDVHRQAGDQQQARDALDSLIATETSAVYEQERDNKALERANAEYMDAVQSKVGVGAASYFDFIKGLDDDFDGTMKLLEASKPADLDRTDIDNLGAGLDNAQRGTPDRTMTMAQSKRIIMDSNTFKKYADAHQVPADELAFARFSREAKAKNKQNQKDKWQAKRAAPIGAAQPPTSAVSAVPSTTATLGSSFAQVRDSVATQWAPDDDAEVA